MIAAVHKLAEPVNVARPIKATASIFWNFINQSISPFFSPLSFSDIIKKKKMQIYVSSLFRLNYIILKILMKPISAYFSILAGCILSILFIVIATQKAMLFIDPDFGWHIRTGQYILSNGIPYLDPFSYSMPHFHFIAHSWLSEVVFFTLLPKISYGGLSFILALIAMASLWIVLIPTLSRRASWFIIPLTLGFTSILSYVSVRPQTISWLFFSIFLVIILEPTYWKKFKAILPIIMVLWVNMHGSFALGIGILSLKYLHDAIIHKKIPKNDFIILLLSWGATLLNPYGIHIWQEVFATIGDDKLRTQVSEWNPLFLRLTFFHIPLLALSLVLAVRFYKKLNRILIYLFGIMLFFGLTSSKLFPFWSITAVYLIAISFNIFTAELKNNHLARERLSIFLTLVSIFSLGLLILYLPRIWSTYGIYTENSFYPQKATHYIDTHPIPDNLFAPFNWSGYLLWKLPQKKVFVDGRMTHWEKKSDNPHYSTDAFTEYNSILEGTEFLSIPKKKMSLDQAFKKFNINSVLIPKKDSFEFMKKFRTRMSQFGWKVVYQDDISILYVNPTIKESHTEKNHGI